MNHDVVLSRSGGAGFDAGKAIFTPTPMARSRAVDESTSVFY
jgi:hypothetical protein